MLKSSKLIVNGMVEIFNIQVMHNIYQLIKKLGWKVLLNKKAMALIIFFVSLLVISAASATDNDANDVVNVVDNNTNDVVSVEETSNGIFNTEDDNDVDYTQNNNVLLSSKETDDLNTVEFNSSSANYDNEFLSSVRNENSVLNNVNEDIYCSSHLSYYIQVSDKTIDYGSTDTYLPMVVRSNAGYDYGGYDFYLKAYDVENNLVKYKHFSGTSGNIHFGYDMGELIPGVYTIKLVNTDDEYVMNTIRWAVRSAPYSSYSVNVNDTSFYWKDSGYDYINISVTPASGYYYAYDFYVKIYDANGNEKLSSQRYYGKNPAYSKSYQLRTYSLEPGQYTIKIIDNYDNYVMDTAILTIKSVPHTSYSVNISDTLINYGYRDYINISISNSSNDTYKYDFYLKIYDANGNLKLSSQRYYGKSFATSKSYEIGPYSLNPGVYTLKIINTFDNYVMDDAVLTIKSVPYSSYSVNISNTEICYYDDGTIPISINSASGYYYAYDFYIKIYDQTGNEMISNRYCNTDSTDLVVYKVNAHRLSSGNYIIKILNNVDNHVMSAANLTVSKSIPYSAYSVNISDLRLNYGTTDNINILIAPTLGYYYAYDFYLKIYDAKGNEKISKRYYNSSQDYLKTYNFNSTVLTPGIYSMKIVNHEDNHIMCTAKLYILDSSNLELFSQDYYVDQLVKINYTINSKATGILSIYIDNNFVKNVSAGNDIDLGNLIVGNHTVKVVYNGDDYYIACQKNTTFKIKKYDPIFSFSKNNVIAGDNLVITYRNNDVTGNISYNGLVKQLINGKVSFTINNIKGGLHQFNISYSGDDKYNSINQIDNVSIKFKDSIVDFNVEDIIWGDTLSIAPIVTNGATGYLSIYVDNILNSTINLNNRLDLTCYAGGYHYIKIIYSGDDYYASNSTTKGFNVIRLNSTCNIIGNIEVDNSASIYVTLNEDAAGDVSLNIKGTKYTNSLVGGIATFRISSLSAGTYPVTINYGGDSKYDSIYTTKTLEVTLKPSTIVLDVKNILTGNDVVIKPVVTSGATGNIKVYVDNVLKTTLPIGSSYTISAPSIGKHEVRVVYSGDDYHQSSENKSVFRVFTFYPIEVQNTAIIYGTDKHFQATFYDEYGNVLANKYVAFSINGTDTLVMTNDNGLAIFNQNLDLGTYYITAINTFVSEELTSRLDVFTSIQSEDMTRAYNTGVDFKVKLLDDDANTLINGYALFKVNNNEYTAKTDNNGYAILNANLPVGTYYVITTNARTGESKTNKITIVSSLKADNMIRGYHSGIDFKAQFLGADAKPLMNQNVAFIVDNIEYEATTDANGFAVLNKQLDVGNYEVTIVNKVTGERGIRNLTIVGRIVENNDVFHIYNEESYYTIHVIGDDGNYVGENEVINININHINYQIRTNNNGYASFRIDENIGSYDILAEYKGYEVYNKVYVLERVNYINNLNASNINYKQNELLNLSLLTFEYNADVVFEIIGDNGYEATFDQSAMKTISLPLNGLNAGKYTVTAEYYDLNTFKFSSVAKTFYVNKIDPKIIVVVENANVGKSAKITVNIPNVEGNVEIKVGNVLTFNEYLVKNGVIVKEINTLPASVYNVDVTYKGDTNYNQLTQSTTLTIIQPKILTNIVAYDVITTQGKGTTLVATLKDVNGNVLVGKGVSIYFNGINSILTTGKNGQVKLTIPNNLKAKTYTATITFASDNYYVGSKITVKVIVNKAPMPKPTITLKTIKVKKSAKKLILQATLKQGKTPLKSKKIVFKFNGKKYAAKTNKNGVAKVTIKKKILKKLKVGKKVKYQASYGKIIAKKTAKIKK